MSGNANRQDGNGEDEGPGNPGVGKGNGPPVGKGNGNGKAKGNAPPAAAPAPAPPPAPPPLAGVLSEPPLPEPSGKGKKGKGRVGPTALPDAAVQPPPVAETSNVAPPVVETSNAAPPIAVTSSPPPPPPPLETSSLFAPTSFITITQPAKGKGEAEPPPQGATSQVGVLVSLVDVSTIVVTESVTAAPILVTVTPSGVSGPAVTITASSVVAIASFPQSPSASAQLEVQQKDMRLAPAAKNLLIALGVLGTFDRRLYREAFLTCYRRDLAPSWALHHHPATEEEAAAHTTPRDNQWVIGPASLWAAGPASWIYGC